MSPSEKTQPRLNASGGKPTKTLSGSPESETTRVDLTNASEEAADRAPAAASAPAAEREEQKDAGSDTAGTTRKVRLTVARLNPWSVAKLAFLLSVAAGVVFVVAVGLLWSVLDGMGVISDLNGVVSDVVGSESSFNLMDYLGLSRVLSIAITLAVIDVVLLTIMATVAAVLYNLASSLVGGLRLTLSDD